MLFFQLDKLLYHGPIKTGRVKHLFLPNKLSQTKGVRMLGESCGPSLGWWERCGVVKDRCYQTGNFQSRRFLQKEVRGCLNILIL